MKNPMNKWTNKLGIRYCLLLLLVTLLSACDGGIFGTGGPDELEGMNTIDAAAPMPGGESDSAGATSDTASGSDAQTGGNADAGGMDGGTASNVTEATDGGSADGGAGGQTDGFTDAGAADGGATDGGASGGMGTSAPNFSGDVFRNEASTLTSSDARVNLINTTDLPLNAIQSAADSSLLLFGEEGVAPATTSASSTLQLTQSTLSVVNNNTRDENISVVADFTVVQSSFTTLLVRNNGSSISTIPLVSLTTTNDAMVAKVRLIQADTFGEPEAFAQFTLQSGGEDPAGMDSIFGPLSFNSAVSGYVDITSGDYELVDSLARVATQPVTFEGANVYTVVVVDSGPAIIVNDTLAAQTQLVP